MHRHDHERVEDDATRQAGRTAPHDDGLLYKAAAAGRADVLGPAGMLRLQRAVGNDAAQEVGQQASPVTEVLSSGGGQALDEPVRTDMEARLGADFSDVRVHTDGAADGSARSVQAHAYTVGSNIVFQRDRYEPGTPAGQTLLAHELTHVMQQRSGPVDGTATADGVKLSDPSDRFEREAAANADRVMSTPAPAQREATAAAGTTSTVQASKDLSLPTVQRAEAGEEEEEVQASHDASLPAVQRDEEEGEKEEGTS